MTLLASLALLAEAIAAGWSVARAVQVLGLGRVRAHRWDDLGQRGALADRRPGGTLLHGLLPAETQ